MEEQFLQRTHEILQERWRTSPVAATRDGIHDWDSDLDCFDPDFRQGVLNRKKEHLRELEKFSPNLLSADARLDHQLLTNALLSEVADWEDLHWWRKDPGLYFSVALQGIYLLREREFAPLPERARCILSRLRQIPRLLTEGMSNLLYPPRVFIELALEVTDAGEKFIAETVSTLGTQLPALADELSRTGSEARFAMEEARKILQEKYLPGAGEDFAIGEELFNFKLRVDHVLPHTAADLWDLGEEAVASSESQLEREALGIAGTKDWRELIGEFRKVHPEPGELLAVYRQEMGRAREFVIARGLAVLAPGEELEVVATPVFERPTTPYAALVPPAAFDEKQKGFFFVTPVENSLPSEERRERLQEHSRYAIPIIACHEGYPGHHLQLTLANQHPSRVRRVLGTPVFWEGWALYCEEMMYEEGFYQDPRCRLFQLKDQLWRACRILADVGLHVRGKTRAWAVDLLVERAGLARANAAMEVERYCSTPTYQLSYYVGKLQILELRRRWQVRSGSSPLGDFHNWVLSFGSLPPSLVPL